MCSARLPARAAFASRHCGAAAETAVGEIAAVTAFGSLAIAWLP